MAHCHDRSKKSCWPRRGLFSCSSGRKSKPPMSASTTRLWRPPCGGAELTPAAVAAHKWWQCVVVDVRSVPRPGEYLPTWASSPD